MKRLMIVAGLCAAFCAGAMPTKEALEAARPRVLEMTAEILDKLISGELKPGGGAEALVAFAEKETGEAEKFLLLNGALRLHMRGGDIAGAKVVADKLRADIKGLTAEQLNDMMLEESNNFISKLLNENVAKAPEKNGPKWHVRKSRLERSGLTVTSLDELRKCDRSKVERLYLRGAKNITAQDLEGLTSIRALDLSETGIEEIPSCVFKMKNLRWLWLARNPIKAVADDIRELRCLQYLNLDGTQVDKIPAGLTHLPSFHYLRMNGTPLDDGIYADAKGAKRSLFIETLCCLKLKRFYARNTKITMLPRAGLSGQMTDLDVGGTLISEIPPEAEWIGRLRTISFAGCKKLKRLPENLDGWSKVLLIDLSDTPIAKDKDEIVRIRRAVGDKTTIIY